MALFVGRKVRERRGEAYIALDLGTEAIKCLVYENREAACHIKGKGKVLHRPGTLRGGMVINIPEAAMDARQAVLEACDQAGIAPKRVVMSLSGDLVKSLVTTVHYHRPRPDAHIDANELKNIIYKAQWKAFEQIRSLVAKEQEEADLGVKLIKHDYGADPAAVAFDAIAHAKSKNAEDITFRVFDTYKKAHGMPSYT